MESCTDTQAGSKPAQGHHCRSEQPRVPLQVASSLQLPSVNELSLACRCTHLLNTGLWLLSHCNRWWSPRNPKVYKIWSFTEMANFCSRSVVLATDACRSWGKPSAPIRDSAPVCLHVPRSPELLQVLPATLRVLPPVPWWRQDSFLYPRNVEAFFHLQNSSLVEEGF